MKVQDLIEALQFHNPDAHVLVSGYESGFDMAEAPVSGTANFYPNEPWYEGQFNMPEDSIPGTYTAVFIKRVKLKEAP